jgi:hypothetical protein
LNSQHVNQMLSSRILDGHFNNFVSSFNQVDNSISDNSLDILCF